MYARELETQLRSLKMHNEVSFKPLSESNITKKTCFHWSFEFDIQLPFIPDGRYV